MNCCNNNLLPLILVLLCCCGNNTCDNGDFGQVGGLGSPGFGGSGCECLIFLLLILCCCSPRDVRGVC